MMAGLLSRVWRRKAAAQLGPGGVDLDPDHRRWPTWVKQAFWPEQGRSPPHPLHGGGHQQAPRPRERQLKPPY